MMPQSSVYITPSLSEFKCCRTDDISLYAINLYSFLESAVYSCPLRIALEMGDRKMTYADLSREIDKCIGGYVSLGIEPGDVILFSMSYSLSLIVALLAALKIGGKICLLPQQMSVLRLQGIQSSVSIALLVHDDASNLTLDIYAFHVHSINYHVLMSKSLSPLITSERFTANMSSSAQILLGYAVDKGFYPIEFPQSVFLKMLHEVDDLVPGHQSSERMLISTYFTQPLFLLEVFYVFMRQSTAVFSGFIADNELSDRPSIRLPLIGTVRIFLEESGWVKPCLTGIQLNGLCISLAEIEYFAKQYPGVTHATASFSGSNLILKVRLSSSFYPYLFVYSIELDKLVPVSQLDQLAVRLSDFLSQHLWGRIFLHTLILEADH